MAFKNRVPQKSQASWHNYWQRLNVGGDANDCKTDGLVPILEKYLDNDKKILEAGCGLGKWVIFLSAKGFDVEGLDNYRPGIEAIKKFDSKLKVRIGDIEKLPYKSESFDYYLSFGVVEHWEDGPYRPLREAYRVLKKGGKVIVETPYDNPLRKFSRFVRRFILVIKLPAKTVVEALGLKQKREKLNTVFYEYHYTPTELSSFISKAGFKVEEILHKDDLSPDRSIGLWLDFPWLRKANAPNFHLNELGKVIKFLFLPFPWFWSCCIVVVAKKV